MHCPLHDGMGKKTCHVHVQYRMLHISYLSKYLLTTIAILHALLQYILQYLLMDNGQNHREAEADNNGRQNRKWGWRQQRLLAELSRELGPKTMVGRIAGRVAVNIDIGQNCKDGWGQQRQSAKLQGRLEPTATMGRIEGRVGPNSDHEQDCKENWSQQRSWAELLRGFAPTATMSRRLG